MRAFRQTPPSLGNTYAHDTILRAYIKTQIPPEFRADFESQLSQMGELAGGELYSMQQNEIREEPRLVSWDAWGERIDRIEVTPLWKRAQEIAASHGLIATGYERRYAQWSRTLQFSLVYLFGASTDVYSCPLAMTDGAAKTLEASGNKRLMERAFSRLTSRDPAQAWTSGQWMTESTGGSDVGLSETRAEQDASGQWRLYGRKWFTSAISAEMALTLARPEGNGPGGAGLALFYVETHDETGKPNQLFVHRLKDKLGTRKVPTAELGLQGTPAELVVQATTHGTRHISPMLNITRTWNAVSALGLMQRGIALAEDYAQKRFAFGAKLADKPLHMDTLAEMRAEHAGAFALTYRVLELLGRDETMQVSEEESTLLRALTPLAKLTTGKQAVEVTSEAIECFGGAGYVEDTGLPTLVRDAHVLPIWEGTTNVLSLDAMRVLSKPEAFALVAAEIEDALSYVSADALQAPVAAARESLARAQAWGNAQFQARDQHAIEAGARRWMLTLGRTLSLALLCKLAQDALSVEPSLVDCAQRYAARGVCSVR